MSTRRRRRIEITARRSCQRTRLRTARGDGGGSIRLPSSWCGLFGLKPQRGRVSAAPNADLWRALGVIGPLTRTVADSALIYDVIAGTTERDRFSAAALPGSMYDAATRGDGRRLRIIVSAKNPMRGPRADAETRAALGDTARVLRDLGHDVIERNPRYPSMGTPFQVQVMGGVSDEAGRVEHPERLERLTRRMVTLGRASRRLGGWAERRAAQLADAFLPELFADADILLTPTTPTAAVPVGQLGGFTGTSRRATATSSYTAAWNLLGNPAAAVPAGFTASGLPLSVQLIAPPGGELDIFTLSAELERARPWTELRPGVASGAV